MFDLIIRAPTIIDGTGAPPFVGDIGIVGERVVALGGRLDGAAQATLDAAGLTVTPGFIDAHTHDDLVVLRQGVVAPKVHQGVTTIITGNCGFSIAPVAPSAMEEMQHYAAPVLGEDAKPWTWPTMGALLETLRAQPLGQHVRGLLGHTALRVAVMGFAGRPASEPELILMETLVAEAMQAGAAGLSFGLMYAPGMYASTDELVRLARVVGRYNGVVSAHLRSEGDHLLVALQEMLTIAAKADVAVHISHLKVIGRKNWGSIARALDLIDASLTRGLSVTVDMYPYTAGSTTITQLLPPWIQQSGVDVMLRRLRDPVLQQRVQHDLCNGLPDWDNQIGMLGWERIQLAGVYHDTYRALEGCSLAEAAAQLALTPADTFLHLLMHEEGRITVTVFSMGEHDVDAVLQAPFAMVGSDGLPQRGGRPHPRLYGTFPRFLQRYTRELPCLTLADAIHKITALPATRFGLRERGTIAVHNIADLVVFDSEQITDRATYRNPQVYPSAIKAVFVAGQPIVQDGKLQPNRTGTVLV